MLFQSFLTLSEVFSPAQITQLSRAACFVVIYHRSLRYSDGSVKVLSG